MNINHLFSISLLATLLSCSNDSTSDLTNPPVPNDNTVVKYTADIAAIINSNCIMCHAATPVNGAPMSLATYNDVKNAILTRPLIDRISRAQGTLGMMPNGGTRLPQATIDKIIKWQTDGLLE